MRLFRGLFTHFLAQKYSFDWARKSTYKRSEETKETEEMEETVKTGESEEPEGQYGRNRGKRERTLQKKPKVFTKIDLNTRINGK